MKNRVGYFKTDYIFAENILDDIEKAINESDLPAERKYFINCLLYSKFYETFYAPLRRLNRETA